MEFNLYGEVIDFSEEEIIFGRVWMECFKDIKYYYDILDKRYVAARSLSYAISDMPALGKIIRDKIIQREIEFLHELGIYHISPDMLYEATLPYLGNLEESLYMIKDKYLQLRGYEKQAKMYREARKEARSKLVGGGFGLDGAIKGMMVAGTVNATTGAIHSVFNMVESFFTEAGVEKEIDRLYRKPSTKKNMQIGLREDIKGYVYGFLKVLGIPPIYIDDNVKSAFAILDNIANGVIKDPNVVVENIVRMIRLCPFSDIIYDFAYLQLGDANGELARLSKTFGITITVKDKIDNKIKDIEKAKEFFGEAYSQAEIKYKNIRAYTELKSKFAGKSLENIIRLLMEKMPLSLEMYMKNVADSQGKRYYKQAKKNYVRDIEEGEIPLIVFDHTITANGKKGFVITNRRIHSKNVTLRLEDIKSITVKESGIKATAQVNGKDLVSMMSDACDSYFTTWLELVIQVIVIYNQKNIDQNKGKEKHRDEEEKTSYKEKQIQSVCNQPIDMQKEESKIIEQDIVHCDKGNSVEKQKSEKLQCDKNSDQGIQEHKINLSDNTNNIQLHKKEARSSVSLQQISMQIDDVVQGAKLLNEEELNLKNKEEQVELIEQDIVHCDKGNSVEKQKSEKLQCDKNSDQGIQEHKVNLSDNTNNIQLHKKEAKSSVSSQQISMQIDDVVQGAKLLNEEELNLKNKKEQVELKEIQDNISHVISADREQNKTEIDKQEKDKNVDVYKEYSCIPGFRSNKKWKKFLAIITYIILAITFISIFKIQYPETYSVTRVISYRMTVILMYVLFLVTPFLILTDAFDLKEKNKFCKKHPFLFRPIFLLGELAISFIILIIMAIIS